MTFKQINERGEEMSQLDGYLKEEQSRWRVQPGGKYVRNISVRKGVLGRWKSHHSCRVKTIIGIVCDRWLYISSLIWLGF